MSTSNIISVAEMIDAAFGEEDANVVNFKLIQAVLYLLARQLRILERRVGVEIDIDRGLSRNNLSVTEIKLRATVPKRKRITKSGGAISQESRSGRQGITTSKTKSIPEYQFTSEKSFEKSAIEKSTTTKSSTDKATSGTTKSSTDKSTSEKTKSSTDKTVSYDTKSSTDKTTSDKTKSSTDKTVSYDTKSSTDKTTSDTTKSSTDKRSTEKSSTDKTSSEKTKSSTDKTSTEKSSSDKTSSETAKSSSDKKTSTEISSIDKTSTEKSSTDKSTTDKTKSSAEKSSTDKTTSSSKKSSSTKVTASSGVQFKGKDLPNILEIIEEQREKELRIIHQRADSRDVAEKSPTPMASLDSIEEQYEKLLVVERVPAERKRSSIGGKRTPQLSIVTQDQFEALATVVRELQSRFTPIATPGFPDNMQLMHELRKGASLTDAMAALQLSARLEAAEKTLKQMLELVTDLASKSGLEIELQSQEMPDDTRVLHDAIETSITKSKKSSASKQSKSTSKFDVLPSPADTIHVSMPSSEPSKVDIMPTPSSLPGPEEGKLVVPVEWITFDELDNAIQNVTNGLLKTLTAITTQSNANAADAIKIAKRLEEKLDSSLNLGSRMNDLELLISKFSEQITVLDTGLSSQMTNYQEQLTQMQHDLEVGLENMAEALANTGGDTAAVTELNTNFTNLQTDVDIANTRQKELTESQNGLWKDLQELWEQIEMLRELKSDRDEVADALRDKAGLADLNGLVSLQQFNAVRGDFEKRIGAAYDKFNNQENTWQKAIDDLLRELNDKADWDQLVALRDDINKNLEFLRNKINAMLEIVGEPRAATVSRKLFRDGACLSCSMPAHMDLEESTTIPKMPAFPGPSIRPPTIGAEDSSKPAEDGDHGVCFPGLPIPHPRDPRSHICHRYCGGSHTLVLDKKSRTPIGLTITPVLRPVTTGIGSDGRTYKIEETMPARKPCLPCNEKQLNTPQVSQAEPVKEKEEFDSDMTPSDFLSALCSMDEQKEDSATPPPPAEEF